MGHDWGQNATKSGKGPSTPPRRRWSRQLGIVALVAATTTTGCATRMVGQAVAGGNPQALIALPFAAIADLLALGASSSARGAVGSSANAQIGANGGYAGPDWLSTCGGPLWCPDHRHFECFGTPGNCECECVISDLHDDYTHPDLHVPGEPQLVTQPATPRLAQQSSPPSAASTNAEPTGE